MDGTVPPSAGQRSVLAVPPATATGTTNVWSTGAPATTLTVQAPASVAAAQNDGSPLRESAVATSSPLITASPPRHPAVNPAPAAPSSTPALDASNVVQVPLVSNEGDRVAHDGPSSDSATQPPSLTSRSAGILSKQSSSYLAAPSFTMSAWRGGDGKSSHNASDNDTAFSYGRNKSQVFDPTEVPELRHTMKVIVTRDGKTSEEQLDPYEVARLYGQQQAALRSLQNRYNFLAVPDWVRVHPLLGTYLAELVGSFAWVLTLALVSVRNKSIFTVADDTNMTAIPIGFMFTSMIFTFGYVSSAHLNPAVSVAVFLIRQIDLSQCFVYILCQLGGAFLAGVMSIVIQGNANIFVPSVPSSYVTSGIFSELIFTFAICLVVLNIAYSRQSGNFFYGFAVGMTIMAGSASVGRISGGAFNPAAATGLQVAMCIISNCDDLKSVWIYWLAPLIGGVAAALLFSQMVQPNDTQVLEDNKVFQDVNLLRKQRSAARAAAADATRNDTNQSHSHTSSSSSSSSDQQRPHTPTSSSNSSDAGGYQEMRNMSQTRTPRQNAARSREEVEEEEEEENRNGSSVILASTHTSSFTPTAPATTTNSTAAAATVAGSPKAPVVTNASDLDNWRKRPPPRREDMGEVVAATERGASSWF